MEGKGLLVENVYQECLMELNIITRPVNSGKTLLVEKMLTWLEADDVVGSWIKEIFKSIQVNASTNGVTLGLCVDLGRERPIDQLSRLLNRVPSMLPTRTLLQGKQNSIPFAIG